MVGVISTELVQAVFPISTEEGKPHCRRENGFSRKLRQSKIESIRGARIGLNMGHRKSIFLANQ